MATMDQRIDDATEQMDAAQRTPVRAALKTCNTAVEAEVNTFGLTTSTTGRSAYQDAFIELCRVLGTLMQS